MTPTLRKSGARASSNDTRAHPGCAVYLAVLYRYLAARYSAFVILASHMPYVARLLDLGAGCLVPCLGSNHLVNAI